MAIATTNPTTGHVEKSFEPAAADEIEQHLARATSTFGAYRLTDLEARSRWMNNAADILDNEVDDIAALMTTEMGKTISSARAEVHKCAEACRFFAANAVRFVADERVDASTVGARSDAVEGILRDERVRAVTLTGSEPAGHSVASIAGSVGKPSVLELGGSDPFIVLPSADVDRAADVAVIVRTLNNGQSCIVAKRFIVDASVADQFERNFVARMKTLRVGDPFDETTDVGPVVNEEAREHLHEFVTDAVAKGARVLCGGSPLAGDGWFYPPTVVAEVTPDMRMFHEEVFGPVAALYRVNGVVEAIELANATDFGLGFERLDERCRRTRALYP